MTVTLQHLMMQSFYFLCGIWFIFARPNTSPLIWDICGYNNNLEPRSWHEDLELSKARAFNWILKHRNDQWGWNHTPAVVLAMQLGDPNWVLSKENLEAQLSLQRMDIEILTYLSQNTQCSAKVNKKEPFELSKFSPGLLAIYINALISSCRDPSDFYGHNLNYMLKRKMEKGEFPTQEFSNYYQYSLGVLALCGSQSKVEPQFVRELLAGQSDDGSFEDSVDVTSLSLMALACVSKRSNITISGNINISRDYLIRRQKVDGSFGNIHSTVLATQALIAAEVDFALWKCEEAFLTILNSQLADGSFGEVLVATTQALPVLNGRSVDPWNNECPIYHDNLIDKILETNKENRTVPTISVSIEIEYGHLSDNYGLSIDSFTVPVNSTLYQAMEIAQSKLDYFSFKALDSEWGLYIQTINGISADNLEKTYWAIYKNEKSSQNSADTLVLQNGDKIKFKYRKW